MSDRINGIPGTYIEFTPDGYATSFEDYPGLSLTLIKDLSENIAYFGRRGETYVRQLTAISEILDDAYASQNVSHTPVALLDDMDKFVYDHNPETRYPRLRSFDRQVVEEGRPLMPFRFIMPRYMNQANAPEVAFDLISNILYHPLLSPSIGTYPDKPIVDFMSAFANHTLYRDLRLRRRGELYTDQSYITYCERWGVPA